MILYAFRYYYISLNLVEYNNINVFDIMWFSTIFCCLLVYYIVLITLIQLLIYVFFVYSEVIFKATDVFFLPRSEFSPIASETEIFEAVIDNFAVMLNINEMSIASNNKKPKNIYFGSAAGVSIIIIFYFLLFNKLYNFSKFYVSFLLM